MDLIRKIPKKFTKKFANKVINRQYFCRKTGLKGRSITTGLIYNDFESTVLLRWTLLF